MKLSISVTIDPSIISKRSAVPVGLLLGSLGLLGVAHADVPKSFSSGQTLYAEDLNENFEALDQRVDDALAFHGTIAADVVSLRERLDMVEALAARVTSTEAVQSNLAARLDAAETSLEAQSLYASPNCTITEAATQCVCAAGEIAISGGVLPTTTSGNGFIVESRNIGPGAVPGTTWQTICKTDAGNVTACAGTQVFCLRLK